MEEIIVQTKPFKLSQRILSAFASPTKLMENIKECPVLMPPILFFLVVGLVLAICLSGSTEVLTQAQSEARISRYGTDIMAIPNADTPEAQQQANIVKYSTMGGMVFGSVTNPYVNGFFMALVLLLVTKVIMKGNATLQQNFSMCVHIFIVTSTLGIITYAYMDIMKVPIDTLSLAATDPTVPLFSTRYALLSSVSLAGIWQALLIFIGVRVLNDNFSNVKAGIAAGVIFLGNMLIAVVASYGVTMFYDFLYATKQMSN
ncbi:hypothetical protein AGMMS49975_12820 [Clostridia bacterium]|nr:hypothetical protein AGMMS49975_12820 [Clostridia bacterium]